MDKYGFGLNHVNKDPLPDDMPRVDIAHDPAKAYFVESAEVLGYDGFSTALPVLAAAIPATDGVVVEVGSGFGSTPILAALCKTLKRPFISLEQEDTWRNVARYFRVPNAPIDHADPEAVVAVIREVVGDMSLGLVFVDGGEPYGSRGALLRLLVKEDVQVVVAHDFDPGNDTSAYIPSIPAWKHTYVYRRLFPYTLFCSEHGKQIEGIRDSLI